MATLLVKAQGVTPTWPCRVLSGTRIPPGPPGANTRERGTSCSDAGSALQKLKRAFRASACDGYSFLFKSWLNRPFLKPALGFPVPEHLGPRFRPEEGERQCFPRAAGDSLRASAPQVWETSSRSRLLTLQTAPRLLAGPRPLRGPRKPARPWRVGRNGSSVCDCAPNPFWP